MLSKSALKRILIKKGTELVEIKATGTELSQVIEKKANEQAKLYSDVLQGLQLRLDGKGLIAFEQVKKAIEKDAQGQWIHHAAHPKRACRPRNRAKGKMDESIQKQADVFNTAVGEQRRRSKKGL